MTAYRDRHLAGEYDPKKQTKTQTKTTKTKTTQRRTKRKP